MTYVPSPLPGACLRACAAAGAAAAAETAFLLVPAARWDAPDAIVLGAVILVCVFIAAAMIAGIHLLVAVPVYRLLSTREAVATPVAAMAGFLFGAVPIPLLAQGGSPVGQDAVGALLFFGLPGLAAGTVFGRRVNRNSEAAE
ncbi:MAG TPA: hypothetical protein VF655_02320 [Allosphingosinicella sp.]|jgi:hypothetical protein